MSLSTERSVVSPEWLLDHVDGRGADELSTAIAALIRAGDLAPGTQLPTVRDLAATGRVSAGSVVAAWGTLRDRGLIRTQRRGGTVVLPRPGGEFAGWSGVDLGQAATDIRLHPPLGEALLSSLDAETLNVFGREVMTDRLRDAVSDDWPFTPEAWMTAGGGTEALLLAIEAAAPPGTVVAVDEPLGPGVLDTLRDLGLHAVGVASDDDGPLPEALRAALDAGAEAFVFQPGAPFAMRHVVTPERTAELAAVLSAGDTVPWVIEDDSIGPLESEPTPSMGDLLDGRVLRIRSFCKAYGIDVRTSVLGGASTLIDRAMRLRSHGVGSNSRILQNTLAHLVRSPEAAASVAVARERYAARRAALLDALRAHGLTAVAGPQSLVVWVEVPDETAALLALARRGIVVGAGSRSFVDGGETAMLRISVTQLPDDAAVVDELASEVAAATRLGAREFFD
jgi:DNA-binding transcriptional MocR family regulator